MLTKTRNKGSSSHSSNSKKAKNSLFFQPKLEVGKQGDKYEAEADSVAEHVVNQTNGSYENFISPSVAPHIQSQSFHSSSQNSFIDSNTSFLQTQEEEEEMMQMSADSESNLLYGAGEDQNKDMVSGTNDINQKVSRHTENDIVSNLGNGNTLDVGVRRKMENSIGANFSDVKVHTGEYSSRLNNQLRSNAFTTGKDIFFNSGKYNPETKSGQKLLAHELTHVVQQQPSLIQRSCSEKECPFEELTRNVIQKNGDQSTEAPQSTQPPLDVNDTLPTDCGDIEPSGIQEIEDFLMTFHSEVQGWEDWRNQENWDNPSVSSTIPSISPLFTEFNGLYNTDFYCTESFIYVIPFEHTEIQSLLMEGTSIESGIDNHELDLINEWMRYERNRSNLMQQHFNLNPESDVEHHYTMNIIAAVGDSDDIAAAGAGLGGAVETPVGKLKLGCFLKIGIGGGYVVFRYSNNIGMTWEQGYLQINVGLSGECSISASIGPAVTSSFGSEDLCSGSADPDPTPDWYGPKDFEGGTIEQSIGVSGGVGATAGVDAAYLYLIIPGKDDLFFNTSGPCMGMELGGHLNLPGINIIQGGGQFAVGGFEGTPSELEEHEGECDNAELEQVTEQFISRIVYFDTGANDLHSGSLAESNEAAISEIVSAISNNLDNPLISSISISVIGHASPVWRGAGSEERAAEENMSLAMERSQNTSFELYDGLNAFEGQLPLVSIYSSGVCEEGSPASEVDFEEESRGSEEGLEQTGDPQNDWQRFRRADITVFITRLVDNNIVLVMDESNPENNVCR